MKVRVHLQNSLTSPSVSPDQINLIQNLSTILEGTVLWPSSTRESQELLVNKISGSYRFKSTRHPGQLSAEMALVLCAPERNMTYGEGTWASIEDALEEEIDGDHAYRGLGVFRLISSYWDGTNPYFVYQCNFSYTIPKSLRGKIHTDDQPDNPDWRLCLFTFTDSAGGSFGDGSLTLNIDGQLVRRKLNSLVG